ncbi:hypothetical protein AJ80_04811 [Polytolypa hystricis UAMH7299]|uniref:Uncharacterized protein n=1 Tax=Polytolypa hystricis (strain UAMH7299) TaxID=1447883 RepID=A0A2B7Y8R0_POLH7|nr:hypothetical protein AJ80_04811 [Polytolypa hystricis UAMH7299]
MAYPNRLAADIYDGDIDGIRDRLDEDADARAADRSSLKAITEHLAHACAKRLQKSRVRILAARDESSSERHPPPISIFVAVMPDQWKVHIYIAGIAKGPTAFDNLTVKGEGVKKPRTNNWDPILSIGTLPSYGVSGVSR